MGSINKSHNEANGGILLYQGELILLYSDSVDCQIGGKASVKGRLFLTTHRVVLIVAPFKPNAPVKSLCAPFCAITKIKLEQPIFGANYIEATVTDESDRTKSFTFKLKFSKGGACEFAMSMNRVVQAVGQQPSTQANHPPSYTPSPSEQFYQAPPTVYAPGYNCGIQMPLNQFPDQPPIGFIYTSTAPPPYPGLPTQSTQNPGSQNPQQQQQHQPQQPQQPQQQYPQSSYPQASYPQSSYPQGSYPQASYPQSSYSQQPQQPASNDQSAPSAPPPPYA